MGGRRREPARPEPARPEAPAPFGRPAGTPPRLREIQGTLHPIGRRPSGFGPASGGISLRTGRFAPREAEADGADSAPCARPAPGHPEGRGKIRRRRESAGPAETTENPGTPRPRWDGAPPPARPPPRGSPGRPRRESRAPPDARPLLPARHPRPTTRPRPRPVRRPAVRRLHGREGRPPRSGPGPRENSSHGVSPSPPPNKTPARFRPDRGRSAGSGNARRPACSRSGGRSPA